MEPENQSSWEGTQLRETGVTPCPRGLGLPVQGSKNRSRGSTGFRMKVPCRLGEGALFWGLCGGLSSDRTLQEAVGHWRWP